MNILLDECVPWPMHKFLVDHQCTTAQQRGWGGIENGDLLRLAEGEFDLFITSDQNVRYQQNLAESQFLSCPRTMFVASEPLPVQSRQPLARSHRMSF